MYCKEKISGIWKWVGIFFGTMMVFTLLSRAIYQQSTAAVTVTAPKNGTIDHTVTITGKTTANQELAVTAVAGLRVAGVSVNEGQLVVQGDVLFTLDMDYLAEELLQQEQEVKKQQLSVQDAWVQIASAQKQQENQQAQAAENYNAAVSQAQTALDRAERDLQRAQQALENYRSDLSEEDTLRNALESAKSALDAKQAALSALQTQIEQAVESALSAAGSELTQEEKDALKNTIRGEYTAALTTAEAEAQQAQESLATAQSDWDAFRQSQSGSAGSSEEALLAAVEQAQEAYEDALATLESTKNTYSRALTSANLPTGTGSSAQIGQITLEQMQRQLEKLEQLRDAEGKILSPTDGIVTKCSIQTGEKTTDTTAILPADLSQGCKFSGLATEEDSQYIGVGDSVTIQTGNGKVYKDLPVTTFSTTEESGGGYRLTVQIPTGNLAFGANVQLQFTKKSQLYACCVPLSALHLDSRNQTYVLVVQEVTSVMGAELQAKKVNVTVLEQNETMAALAEGVPGSKDKVIVGSDKTIDSGSRVRVE